MVFALTVVVDGTLQPIVELAPGEERVCGRSPDCDVILSDPRVSHEHFVLKADEAGRLQFHSLGGKNPVYVNGEATDTAELSPDDLLEVGSVSVRVGSLEVAPLSTSVRLVRGDSDSDDRISIGESDEDTAFGDFPQEDAAERLEALYRLSEVLAAPSKLDVLFADFCEHAVWHTPAERGFIALGDPHMNQFEIVKVSTRDQGATVSVIEMSETILEEVQLRRESLLVRNVGANFEATSNDSIQNIGIDAFMCAPMFARDRFLGMLYVDQPADASRAFERHDLIHLQSLGRLLALAIDDRLVREQNQAERERLRTVLRRDGQLVAQDETMLTAISVASQWAKNADPILISGEVGTGKRTLARWIHDQSPSAEGPFESLDCRGVSHNQLLSKLFGGPRKRGLLENVDGGTLVLAHVDTLPIPIQQSLGRYLDDGRIQRPGVAKPISSDARLIVTSLGPPEEIHAEGSLATELLHHFAPHALTMPPLRERGEDVARVAESFLPEDAELHAAARRAILAYDWPGNVAELLTTMEGALKSASGDEIRLQDLPRSLARVARRDQVQIRVATLQEVEKRHLKRALEAFDGNKTRAAEALGISRETLYQKIKTYGL